VVAAAPLDTIPYQLGTWEGENLPVPEYVTALLTYDAAIHRAYTNDLGYRAHVWVIFWSSRNMVKGYHHPDVCWPNRGFRLESRAVVPAGVGGCDVPLTVREFSRQADRQLVVYWTQEGRRVWTEADERAVEAGGDSHGWLGERLFRRTPADATGRIVVLVGTETWGDGSAVRAQTMDLAARLAGAVYAACPWADPRAAR
jgi:EpsI family protein